MCSLRKFFAEIKAVALILTPRRIRYFIWGLPIAGGSVDQSDE